MIGLRANPDVVVIGAGAAGLSAAKSLMMGGLDVVVVEAADHIGGRCFTDMNALSVPFDRGGSWLHSAEINPLARIAETSGVRLFKEGWEWDWVRTPNGWLNDSDLNAYRNYQHRMWDDIRQAAKAADDVPAVQALANTGWQATANHWVAQMHGADADKLSAKDAAQYLASDGDWLVEGGLGNFVANLHKDVTVVLNCPVNRVDHSGAGVHIETALGGITAKFVVVTVSVGVLAAETIQFSPPLPDEKTSAINQLPNGLLNKVGIEFDPGWSDAHQGQTLDYHPQGNEFCTILFGMCETPLAVGFLAGEFGDAVEAEGPGAATEFCLEALKATFGNDVTKHITATEETAWRSNPLTFGSYSYAKPGGADARRDLARPIDDKVFFAGEATTSTGYATVHGAFQSGKDAAKQSLKMRD